MGAQDTGAAGLETREARLGPLARPAQVCRPPNAAGWVVFAQVGSALGPSQRAVARMLQERGLGTLVPEPQRPREPFHFDGGLRQALGWLESQEDGGGRPVGLLGAGRGSAAVLRLAAERPHRVAAVVCCGGRPDLAHDVLRAVHAPTLLLVAGHDTEVLRLNREALPLLAGEHRLEVVPGAGRRFEEPGALETVGHLAADWFANRLPAEPQPASVSSVRSPSSMP